MSLPFSCCSPSLLRGIVASSARRRHLFTLHNSCPSTVWPARCRERRGRPGRRALSSLGSHRLFSALPGGRPLWAARTATSLRPPPPRRLVPPRLQRALRCTLGGATPSL
ncbi:hypothetical protein ACMD2_25200 [Ananas comosus]|uniref:Uncharacterized protein n=1 Tax=Ananas comosus TaxID=4615 RepID=A0A199UL30_ANACO|nr:hypothetical protein ACMD2_25200 [Ananas comosus]